MNVHALIVSKEEIKKRKGFTGADWWYDKNGDLQVRVEQMSNVVFTYCLMIHEIIEGILCKLIGIKTSQVDEFDEEFDKNHPDRRLSLEAGDAEGCPYALPHSIAISAERACFVFLKRMLGCKSWSDYDSELEDL